MKQIIKLLMVMLMLGGVACTTNDLDGGNQDNDDTNELHNQIWYTATEKVTPFAPNVFGANIVSNVWNSLTYEGVITFDGEVTSIGDDAFNGCTSLASITIPEGVTSIGNYAFCGCLNLASITLPDCVTSIGKFAFFNCRILASITLPEGVTSIGDGAFWSCSSLTSITIPEGVTSIGSSAFLHCTSLASITIPDSVTSIGNGAFRDCTSLAEFNGKCASEDGRCLIVDGVLNSFAPYGLTEYTIPEGVTSIGLGVFENCSDLVSITMPNSVTSIGKSAFYCCSSLASITMPNSVTSIGMTAFYQCSSLAEVYCKPTTPPRGGYSMFGNNASGRKIYVPSGSVEAYKTAEKWSDYADDIEGYDFE
ncbi:MAG: leucine-rich repeat domain-containing protein [Tidjanibacter sp.]|nr:leucine-rich repeat domain-containing protein [Tidjanibacter sp.]